MLGLENDVVEIETLSHEGRGVASVEGKRVFIEGALPEEQVRFRYRKQRKRLSEGEVTEVLRESPDRVKPPCSYSDRCGGCSLQHLSSKHQIGFKQKVVLELLERFGKVQPQNIVAPIIGPTEGYRRKARLGVRYVHKKDKVLVGFREKGGHYLAEIGNCLVLDPRVGEHLTDMADVLYQLERRESIPQIEIATGDEQVTLVIRHLKPLIEADKKQLAELEKKYHWQVLLQSKGPESIISLDPSVSIKPLTYQLARYNLTLEFSPTDFVQINADVNAKLIDRVIEWLALSPTDTVLDLFCGLGNFTLPIATRSQSVIGVEGSEALVAKARDNAKLNAIQNTRFYAADLQQKMIKADWMQQSIDKILLDPPRTGAHDILPFVVGSQAKRVVYVSCNPATLARDAGELSQQGFSLTNVGVVDMFPHTTHVETVALFER